VCVRPTVALPLVYALASSSLPLISGGCWLIRYLVFVAQSIAEYEETVVQREPPEDNHYWSRGSPSRFSLLPWLDVAKLSSAPVGQLTIQSDLSGGLCTEYVGKLAPQPISPIKQSSPASLRSRWTTTPSFARPCARHRLAASTRPPVPPHPLCP